MTLGNRPSGIGVIGDVSWGAHFCLFYDTGDDLSDIIIPFFEAGLQNNEFCMCVASDIVYADRMKELMRAKFPNFDDLLKTGQVEVIPYSEWYLIDGVFDHERVLDGWNEKLRQAQARGFEGARLTWDTFWVDKPIWNDFMEYERAIDGAIEGRNIIVLCTYPLGRCDGGDILDVVGTHQFALTRREGEWKIIENSELKETQEASRESEEKFRALTETSPAMVFFHQGGKHLYVNPAVITITGYSQAELLNMDFWMLVAPEYRDDVKVRGLARLKGENPDSRYPVKIVTKQGIEKWLEVWTALMEYHGQPAVMVTALDITERKQAEWALMSSEEKYRELVENANSIIIRWDTQGNLTFFNEYAEKLFGYKEEEVLGRNVVGTIVPPAESTGRDLAVLMENVKRYPERYELYVNENMRKNGERVWIAWTNKAIRDKQGNLMEILSVGNDITERKRAEEALWNTQAHLSSVFRAAPTGIGVVVDRVIAEANDRLCEMTGYTREELLGRSARIFYPTDEDYEYVGLEKYSQIEQLGTGTVETRWRRKDGSMIDILLSSTPLEPGDLHVGVTFTALDITKRKQAEKALIRERFILTKSQEIAHVGNWSLDIQAGESMGSIENYRIYGYEPGEVKPTLEWILSRIHPEDRPEVDNFMEANVRDGKLGSIDFRIIRPDGSIRYVNTIVDKAVRDKAGMVKRLYGISQDVTERKRAEEELLAAKQQSELYLDLMGHDINNMHQVALGYLELARDTPPGEKQVEFMDKSVEVLQRSTKLIGNVRKLQKLHDGVFQAGHADVCSVLADIQSEYGAVPGKAITLNLNGHETCHVHANELLHDVLTNLVNNAVKHTKDGTEITVSLDIVDNNNRRFCQVAVEDDGPGIPDDYKERIFNRMHKGSTRGMGLGLYLVKTLVDNYGGQVWVEDRIQGDHTKGARFVVMLPAIK